MNNIERQRVRVIAGGEGRRQRHCWVNFPYLYIKMLTIEIITAIITMILMIQIIVTFTKSLTHARHCAKCPTRNISFSPHSNLMTWVPVLSPCSTEHLPDHGLGYEASRFRISDAERTSSPTKPSLGWVPSPLTSVLPKKVLPYCSPIDLFYVWSVFLVALGSQASAN